MSLYIYIYITQGLFMVISYGHHSLANWEHPKWGSYHCCCREYTSIQFHCVFYWVESGVKLHTRKALTPKCTCHQVARIEGWHCFAKPQWLRGSNPKTIAMDTLQSNSYWVVSGSFWQGVWVDPPYELDMETPEDVIISGPNPLQRFFPG